MMKGFNITWYDDRRVCHTMGCTELMIAFKWDHAVRDFLDPEKRFPTLCCLPANRSQLQPPVDECSDPSKYQQVHRLLTLLLRPCAVAGAGSQTLKPPTRAQKQHNCLIRRSMELLQEGIRCLHTLHEDSACTTPTLNGDGVVPQFTYYNYTVDHKWITDRAPDEAGWRFPVHAHGGGLHKGCQG